MRAASCVAVAVLVLLACGCGGRHDSGRAIFAASCAGCHTLTGHDTQVSGGDLAVATRSVAAIASFTRVMPVRLSATQVRSVAAYVHTTAAKLHSNRPSTRRLAARSYRGILGRVARKGKARPSVVWKEAPEEHDFPAASDSLSLLYAEAECAAIVEKPRTAPSLHRKAKDLLRASGLPLLPSGTQS